MSKLVPVICKNETQVLDASYTTGRRRPVVALNAKGEMVVCCKRTARKQQMKIEGRLFVRPTKADRRAAPRAAKAEAVTAILNLLS